MGNCLTVDAVVKSRSQIIVPKWEDCSTRVGHEDLSVRVHAPSILAMLEQLHGRLLASDERHAQDLARSDERHAQDLARSLKFRAIGVASQVLRHAAGVKLRKGPPALFFPGSRETAAGVEEMASLFEVPRSNLCRAWNGMINT